MYIMYYIHMELSPHCHLCYLSRTLDIPDNTHWDSLFMM